MKSEVSPELTRAWQEGWTTAQVFRLSLPKKTWAGLHGSLKKQGTGQSIDFNDHRPYVNGDDIRFVNWKTYARTGQLVLKTFEDEVSPFADIIVDMSHSMLITHEKKELLYRLMGFITSSCIAMNFSVRLFLCTKKKTHPIESFSADQAPSISNEMDSENLRLDALPWHHQSLRVLISDLLFKTDPVEFLKPFLKGCGVGYIFCPYDKSEQSPAWDDITEIEDIENKQKHWLQATPGFYSKYHKKYQEHFEAWQSICQSSDLRFSRCLAQQPWSESVKSLFPSVEVI